MVKCRTRRGCASSAAADSKAPHPAGKSVSPLYELRGLHYGYLWWLIEYPYKDRKVSAFFAGGNGGQVVMAVPDLDLVIAFYGGNYNDAVTFTSQRVYVPQYVLPAVQ
jgi:CubicO group peptidase (beta-lactamase class C family)